MILSNISHLDQMLHSSVPIKKTRSKRAAPVKTRTVPLFKISASLSAPEIVVTPMSADLYKMMVKFVKGMVDTTRKFHRWQHGSCILTAPQVVAADEEPMVFSFHTDIVNNTVVVNSVLAMNQTITRSFSNLVKFLDTWRRYRPLWKVDKVVTLEKFAQKKPHWSSYDEKLIFYSKLARDVANQPTVKDIDFIRVQVVPLQLAIEQEANAWVTAIGGLLILLCRHSFD